MAPKKGEGELNASVEVLNLLSGHRTITGTRLKKIPCGNLLSWVWDWRHSMVRWGVKGYTTGKL